MKMRFPVVLILGLALAGSASAQTSVQKLFDGIASRKTSPPPAAPQRESDARLIEILVELAWLGDSITFPFYIEARMEGGHLHLRGNVPSKDVHDHAFKLAQMNTPLPLTDDLRENPRLVYRPTRMPPDQLDKVVRAALRESLPRLSGNLQVRSAADGQVAVVGNVDTFEQKLLISQALRRLHGCTVALNRTRVGTDLDGKAVQNLIHPPPPAPPAQAVATGVVNSSPLGAPPQQAETMTNTVVMPVAVAPVGPRLTPAQLQKRIQEACPRAKEIKVTLLPTGEHKIEIHVRDSVDEETCFRQAVAIPGLDSYRPTFFTYNDSPAK